MKAEALVRMLVPELDADMTETTSYCVLIWS